MSTLVENDSTSTTMSTSTDGASRRAPITPHSNRRSAIPENYTGRVRLEVRFQAIPVEGLRAFMEPLGYRFDWGPELDGIGFQWLKRPLSGTGVRATYFPDDGDGLLVLETDGQASVTDAAVQDV